MTIPAKQSLVLFKNRAALVLAEGDKLEIEIAEGGTRKVRPKDVQLLHPGPLASLASLPQPGALDGEVDEAWELLEGSTTTLEELADLIHGDFTPATAWATWLLVAEGDRFTGTIEKVQVLDAEVVAERRLQKETKAREAAEWAAFIKRVETGTYDDSDHDRLSGVVSLGLGKTASSKVLKDLGRSETPEGAHALLLRMKYWPISYNPYPDRHDVPRESPELPVAEASLDGRRDLTHLAAYAIDDDGNKDPDDAISIDGDRLWIHVADVASLVQPNSDLDLEARGRGANSYLPERTTTMLPEAVTHQLGLGLQELSPALSFGVRLDENGEVGEDVEVAVSMVKVTRMTYAEAETVMDTEPFASMNAITQRFRERRQSQGAALLNLPEVKISVKGDDIEIRPLPRLNSREMVTDAMLMAGVGAARFAQSREIPIPHATQDPPDQLREPEDLAAMFAYRKQFKRTRMQTTAGFHAGLGLPIYARATSPLRRYLDLVVHQQLRASLLDEPVMDADEVLNRVGAAEAVGGNLRRAERASNKHWILVYLLRNPDWQGEGVLVDKRRGRGIIIVPELGLETAVAMEGDPELNTVVKVHGPKVDLPGLSVTLKADW